MSYNQQENQWQRPRPQLSTGRSSAASTLILIIIIGVICFGAGWWFGQTHFIQTSCSNYPFLLLDPNHYMACQVR